MEIKLNWFPQRLATNKMHMIYHEFIELMVKKVFSIEPEIKSSPDTEARDSNIVEAQFLVEVERLTTGAVNNFFPEKPFLSIGIDGCAGKWVAVALTEYGFDVSLHENIA